jgi:fucose permease
MRFKPRILFSLLLMAVAAYAVFSARRWNFKASLFPLATGMPLFVLAGAQLLLELFGRGETSGGPAVELDFSTDVDPVVARKRVIGMLAWIAGFILLVFLVGFPVAVPLFMFSYLSLQDEVRWWQTIGLTAVAWGFFYGIFQRLIHLQFEDGLLQSWLGM